MKMKLKALIGCSIVAVLAFQSHEALSHEGHKSATPKGRISSDVHPWGQEGDPRKAKRTVTVDMADTMRFSPAQIKVKRGETVRFVVRNSGKLVHEMVIGTQEELAKHAELMRKFPEMEHEAPYMAHVKPGTTEEMTWTFSKPGTFHYGCLEPGHWEAGMKGSIVVATN
jgi:uncharacterized cupredoxin-like copper-binding protein